MAKLDDIATKVDQFSTVGLELATLLQNWDPVHADLIIGVLGIVKKVAKTYESSTE